MEAPFYKLVFGVDVEGGVVTEATKLIIMDDRIETKILKLFEEWQKLELESRRKDLSKRKNFDQK